ncbi:hypothetical protein A5692_17095 [Mycobacterium sp. E342]|uniref:hypothetical protein n=1 Tax=unclassified Mycobacterium TaxID=2642494 RepID=UPI000800B9B6|nr:MULTISPECIES: hypothetical protein [unclassified Mycobacterium]OBH01644.1 hypothetical protein A9X04_26720 [Mycobacterium sp. E3247]OBH31511.1 hypothetical protein A5692_17095 [Mycobacterium sp. E342]
MIKNGTRLQSQVCDTQLIVVRSSEALDDLRIGGAPAVPIPLGTQDPKVDSKYTVDAFAGGTVMGKRYVAADGAEVLVTRAGKGSLSIGTTPMAIKEVKPLPASD